MRKLRAALLVALLCQPAFAGVILTTPVTQPPPPAVQTSDDGLASLVADLFGALLDLF